MQDDRPVGIVVPVEEELAPYRRLLASLHRLPDTGPWEVYRGLAGTRPVVVVVSDCGPANAAAATERLLAQLAPRVVLQGGSAGAHNPELLPGDVVVASAACLLVPVAVQAERRSRGLHPKQIRFRRDGARVHLERCVLSLDLAARAVRVAEAEVAELGPWTGPGWPDGTARRPGKVVVGLIGSLDSWTRSREELESLREAYGAECEDMESAFVAQVCAMHEAPCLAVRVISDNEVVRPVDPADVPAAIAAAGERAARVLVRVAAEV